MIPRNESSFYQNVALWLIDARAKKGLSQSALAERVGMGRGTLAMIETGGQRIGLFQFIKIAMHLHLDIGGLVGMAKKK